ncbi:MAG: hypothetical protein JRI23_01380 [Deltaproteobacteria bacterium]|jgi:hypothetical protein|nr:hypothetical protein [Deltaproteobacteria bacterium]MBW2530113.1 hypothetical protein [Deltaproteobacteria bacterium]
MRTIYPILTLGFVMITAGSTLGACTDDEGPKATPAGSTPTGGGGTGLTGTGGASTGTGGTAGSGGTIDPPDGSRRTISGDATWSVDFDATAEGAGATDCTYTRHYEGVEDGSAPWLCPACEVMFRTTVQMTAGQVGCFDQVSDTDPFPDEWIGWGNGVWWRGYGGPASDQGTATPASSTVGWTNNVPDLEATVIGSGQMTFDVSGSFTLAIEDGDPMHGWNAAASYSCVWPKSSPPTYTGDYSVKPGGVLPDGLFRDVCGDVVRLHDFAGSYLLVVMSAVDCPACQGMAAAEASFLTNLSNQGIDAHVITLLAPALDDPIGDTTPQQLQAWTSTYGDSPVLADRAWGVSMFLALYPDTLSYPSWVLAAPDLEVLDYESGFGGYEEIEATIVTHAP